MDNDGNEPVGFEETKFISAIYNDLSNLLGNQTAAEFVTACFVVGGAAGLVGGLIRLIKDWETDVLGTALFVEFFAFRGLIIYGRKDREQ